MRILVVGAGISGLTLTLALQKRGIRAVLMDKSPEFDTPATAVHLPPNAVRVLALLGVEHQLRGMSQPVHRQIILDHEGLTLSSLSTDDIWNGVGACFNVPYGALRNLLRLALAIQQIRLNTEVVAVSSNGRVHYRDGGHEDFDLIVGADGPQSLVRRELFDRRPRHPGLMGWHFVAKDISGCGHDQILRVDNSGRSVLTSPLGSGRTYCYVEVDSTRVRVPQTGWQAMFAGFRYETALLLEQAENAYLAPDTGVIGTDWVRSQAVLIGDAAHPFPYGTLQGSAMAVEDALVLAETLMGASTLDAALVEYQKRRTKRVAWVAGQDQRERRFRTNPNRSRTKSAHRRAARVFAAYAQLHDMP